MSTPTRPGIRNSWSFMAFAAMNGKPKLAHNVNSETGEHFDSVAFVKPDGAVACFVSFSRNLGTLSASEISARKNDLQVVELESGNYSLCKRGEGNWEDIDI